MNSGILVQINTFDDGNDKYTQYPNEWMIIGSMFGGGKLKLKNLIRNDVVINSISAWKTSQISCSA